jgi:hypothetical protein
MESSEPDHHGPRWQYLIMWRYGAMLLAGVGLALLGFGASGLCPTAISVTMLPLGFLLLVAGVILPRLRGPFSAGPTAVTGEVVPVYELDKFSFSATGRAIAPLDVAVEEARVGVVAPAPELVKLGDVWDAIEESGFRPVREDSAAGTRFMEGPDGQAITLLARGFVDWGIASDELLAVLASWGVRPVASGRYPVPDGVDPDYAKQAHGERFRPSS